MYTDVVGSTSLTERLGDARAHRLMRRHQEQVRQELRRYGGYEVTALGDGFQLAFPDIASSLACAAAIQRSAEGLGDCEQEAVRLRVGLHIGEVFRAGSGMMGLTAILAQRIMSVAQPGVILMSHEVSEASIAPPGTSIIKRGAYHLKGLTDTYELFELIWRPAIVPLERVTPQGAPRLLEPAPAPPFVGRQEELRELLRALADSERGGLRVIAVTGEAGIGKSRLVSELMSSVGARDLTAGQGRSFEEDATPFQSFSGCLRAWLQADPPLEAPAAVLAELAPLSRFFEELRDFLPELPQELPYTGTADRRSRLLEALASLIVDSSAHRPVLFALDDSQWIDEQSLDLLRALTRRALELGDQARLLIVLTIRESELEKGARFRRLVGELDRSGVLLRMPLAPLTEDAVATLIRWVGSGTSGSQVAQFVTLHSRGNPLFASELYRDLVERESGVIPRIEAGIQMPEVSVPSRLGDVIERRLSRLTARARGALERASVLGEEFALGALSRMVARSESELVTDLTACVDSGVLREIDLGGDVGYQFEHGLIATALYQRMSLAHRRRAHRDAANVLEVCCGSRAMESSSQIARHLRSAGRWAPAAKLLEYCEHAAEAASAVYAFREATELYSAALDACDALSEVSDTRRANLECGAFWALGRLGRVDEARALADSAIATFEGNGDRDRADRARSAIASTLILHVRNSGALSYLEKALAGTPKQPTVFHGTLLARYAMVLDQVGQAQRLRSTALTLKKLARRLDDAELEERAGNALRNWYVNHTPHFHRALELTRTLADSAERRDDPWYTALYQNEIAFLELLVGRVRDALQSVGRALETAEGKGVAAEVINARATAALCHCFRGDWQAFEETWSRAAPLLAEVPGAVRAGLLIWARRRVDFWLGRDSARLPSPRRIYAGMPSAHVAVGASAALVLSEQDAEAGERALSEAEVALSAGGSGLNWFIAAQGVASGWCNLDRAGEAAAGYSRLAPYRGRLYLGATDLECARIARLNGWWDAGERDVARAVRTARREGLEPILGLALLERARLRLARGCDPSEQKIQRPLREALVKLERLGMRNCIPDQINNIRRR